MNQIKYTFLFSILFLNLSFNSVHADEKKFARSYTSYTLPANALELEI
jgi:hypothetical protein